MNASVRATLSTLKAPSKHDTNQLEQKKKKMEESLIATSGKSLANQRKANKEKKMILLQDVDKLKRKLRQEENVHRALERAFNRPLGALPRLPSYLPRHTLELLAEVAVLEEEVVRLEKQVVSFRQGLYQEAVYICSKKDLESSNSNSLNENSPSKHQRLKSMSQHDFNSMITPPKEHHQSPSLSRSISSRKLFSSDQTVKSGQRVVNSKQASPKPNLSNVVMPLDKKIKESPAKKIKESPEKKLGRFSKSIKLQMMRISSSKDIVLDPYSNFSEWKTRELGPYKHLCSVNSSSIDLGRRINASFLISRLKFLLKKLSVVNLEGLSHQQKLAFWINTYNSCVMNVRPLYDRD